MPGSLTAADLFKPDFANYQQRHTVVDEGGNQTYQGVSQDQWNSWTDQQKLDDYLSGDSANGSVGGAGYNGAIGPNDPHYAQLRDALGLPKDTTQLISVAHVPDAATGGQSMLGAVFGPDSKPLALGDDYYAFTPEMIAEARRKAQTGNKWDIVRNAALIWGAILTAGAATGAFGAADVGAGAVAAGGGDESLGLAGTGTYGGTAGAATGATTGATTTAGSVAGDESAGLLGTGSYSPGPGAFADEATGITQAGTSGASTGAAPGAFDAGGSTGFGGTTPIDAGAPAVGPDGIATQAPAPVSSAYPAGTQAAAPVVDASTPAASSGNGLINGVRSAAGSASDWYNGLSPAARMAVNMGVSTAGQAVTGALRQRSAQQYANEQEQRTRADTIRRGQVPVASGNPYTPKPDNPIAGIINGVRKGP